MHAIDTNVLVRLLTGDDAKQVASAEAFLGRVGHAWVSHIVLVEVIWVLESVYERDRGQIASALTTLLDHRSFVLQDADVVQAAFDLFKSKRSPGFSECLVLETARRAGHLPLATFDRALGAVEGAEKI
jgi:predicted nucleic-acid-binding protein